METAQAIPHQAVDRAAEQDANNIVDQKNSQSEEQEADAGPSRQTGRPKKKKQGSKKRKRTEPPPTTAPPQANNNDEQQAPDALPDDVHAKEERRKAALQMMLAAGAGDRDRAAKALSRQEEDNPEICNDEAEWAEEAMVWLAMENECEDEAGEMGEAMRISLEEHEIRKNQEKPLNELSKEEVLEAFKDSRLLALPENHSILELPLEHPEQVAFRQYLAFESKCMQWYSISKFFFENEAKAIATKLARDKSATKKASAEQDCSRSQKGKEIATSAQKSSSLANLLVEKLRSLEQEVYGLPASDEDNAVPETFKNAAPADHVECVEILDD